MAMSERETAAPGQVDYLDAAARSRAGRDYKDRLLRALDLRPGHIVLDVGCGPGTDLAGLADAVTVEGAVIGVDHDPEMVDVASRRLAGRSNVEVRGGDAHHLPLGDASVDRARADRVLQHVQGPARVVAEMRRVLRPGGVLGLAEPDWHTLAIDSADPATSDVVARFLGGQVRNPTVGRQLVRLSAAAGLALRTVDVTPVVFSDFAAAEQILGLRRNSARAVRDGLLTEGAAAHWLQSLADGPFLAYFTLVTVTSS